MSWSYKIADKSMAKCREPSKRILPRIKGNTCNTCVIKVIHVYYQL